MFKNILIVSGAALLLAACAGDEANSIGTKIITVDGADYSLRPVSRFEGKVPHPLKFEIGAISAAGSSGADPDRAEVGRDRLDMALSEEGPLYTQSGFRSIERALRPVLEEECQNLGLGGLEAVDLVGIAGAVSRRTGSNFFGKLLGGYLCDGHDLSISEIRAQIDD